MTEKPREMLGLGKLAKRGLTKGMGFDILTHVAAREQKKPQAGGTNLENDTERNEERTVRF